VSYETLGVEGAPEVRARSGWSASELSGDRVIVSGRAVTIMDGVLRTDDASFRASSGYEPSRSRRRISLPPTFARVRAGRARARDAPVRVVVVDVDAEHT